METTNEASLTAIITTIAVATLIVISVVAFIFWASIRNKNKSDGKKKPETKPEEESKSVVSHPKTKRGFWGHIKRVILVLFGLFLLWNLWQFSDRFFRWWDRPAVEVKTLTKPTLYRFEPMGCVTVEIDRLGEVKFYPKGGEVLITPPQNTKPHVVPWKDKPGTVVPDKGNLPKGYYKICGTDKDAFGIEIWN